MQMQSFDLAAMRGVVLEIRPAPDRVGWHVAARLKRNPAAIVSIMASASQVSIARWGDAPNVVVTFGDASFTLGVKDAERLALILGVDIEHR